MSKKNINKCGDCTLCCVVFPVKELKKTFNTPCSLLCSTGCSIYNNRPKECSDYYCAWVQEDNVTVELRPDKCGIMFTKLDERIMFGLIDPNNTPSEMGIMQIHAFVDQGYSVVMSSKHRKDNKFFINSEHKEEDIRNEFQIYIIEYYGDLRD